MAVMRRWRSGVNADDGLGCGTERLMHFVDEGGAISEELPRVGR
jgi:hypothetical protein